MALHPSAPATILERARHLLRARTDSMPVQRLITIPERLADRARHLVDEPSTGYESFNELVVDALSQLLAAFADEGTGGAGHGGEAPGGVASAETAPAEVPSAAGTRRPAGMQARKAADLSNALEALLGAEALPPDAHEALKAASEPPATLEDTRLSAVDGSAFAPENSIPVAPAEFMFNFHNRDYPSLWALRILVQATGDGPVDWETFRVGLVAAALGFGEGLRALDESATPGLKASLMFPRLPRRRSRGRGRERPRESIFGPPDGLGEQWDASRVDIRPFPAHAVGGVARSKDSGTLEASGPLPQWGAIVFFEDPSISSPRGGPDEWVGPTEVGLELLGALEGISLDLPHTEAEAKAFLDFLGAHDPKDLLGFVEILGVIVDSPNRDELNDRGSKALGFDGPTGRATGTIQGYVSRCREWGLVEPRLSGTDARRYELTDAGRRELKRAT